MNGNNPMKYHDIEIQNVSLQIGEYKLSSLNTARFGLDGGAMFGTVPKILWSKTNPSDDSNRIPMECRCLLLEGKDKKILVDTGLGADFETKYGPKLGPKFRSMYNVEGDESGILEALREKGLSSDDITDVILTHLHFDHAGGATKASPSGEIVPTFKNATYYVQKENLRTAESPNLREKASYYKCNFGPLLSANVLKLIDGPGEIIKNISSTTSHGHTQGQQNIWIESDGLSLLYCADLIPTATHVRLPWVMGYDLSPLDIIEEKRRELTKACHQDSYLFFEHDPYCEMAKAKPHKDDFRLSSLYNLSQ